MRSLPTRSDVVIVGGGIMGVSAAYYLAKNGCRNVVLLERDTLGSGSTGRSAGGIRAQFSDELNVRVALECIRRFGRFAEEPGAQIDFRQCGYLFLLTTAEDVARFRESVALQRTLGAPSRLLGPGEVSEIVPGLCSDDVLAATYCPLDGCATPEAVVQGYARAAAGMGAQIVQSCPVKRVVVRRGRVVGVESSAGKIGTARVICAAGVWSPEVAATAGVELPVSAERRWVHVTEPGDSLPHELPLTIDFASGFYFHREGDALLLGGRQQRVEDLAAVAVRRLPPLAERPIRASWWGLYEMSPDRNAVVGATSDPEGFLYATGFSGHGFQQGPVVGEYLAQLALGIPPDFDLGPFDVRRFEGRGPRTELNVV